MSLVFAARFDWLPQVVFTFLLMVVSATFLVLAVQLIIALIRGRPGQRDRSLFTKVKILASFIVVACGFFFILPTGGGPVRISRIAHVRSEMDVLKASITQFRVSFRVWPPSGIRLYEDQNGWFMDPGSRSYLKQIWPHFQFDVDHDLNRESDSEDRFDLTGAECLVFFLGGIVANDAGESKSSDVSS